LLYPRHAWRRTGRSALLRRPPDGGAGRPGASPGLAGCLPGHRRRGDAGRQPGQRLPARRPQGPDPQLRQHAPHLRSARAALPVPRRRLAPALPGAAATQRAQRARGRAGCHPAFHPAHRAGHPPRRRRRTVVRTALGRAADARPRRHHRDGVRRSAALGDAGCRPSAAGVLLGRRVGPCVHEAVRGAREERQQLQNDAQHHPARQADEPCRDDAAEAQRLQHTPARHE